MAGHIKAVALINIITGFMGVGLGVFLFLLFFVPGLFSGKPEDAGAMFACGIIAGGFFAVTSIPAVIAGFGILNYRNWARIIVIVLAVINAPFFPIGTAFAIYEFWVMMHPDVRAVIR